MKQLFVEKNLDLYINFLKVNKKKLWMKRIAGGIGLFLLMVLGFLAFENPLFLILSPILGYLGYKMPYLNLISKKSRIDIANSFLFPHFLRTFISLLGTQGNVYQTLSATVPYVEEPLKSEVFNLVQKIEKDNNRKHYLDFAEYIGSNEAHLIMSMIYEFSNVGTHRDMLTELERYIDTIQQNKTRELKEYKVRKMESHANIPILSTVVFVLVFALGCLYAYFNNMSSLM